ncbi:BON domain-containing protein [Aliishimia ponticola]|uniref:BON domain-containing protein n=1 Tax=Aliishimia ponticola TaxID=2499833 RepID=A0A4S4N7W6_9RHOB|nr:OmpA family protein [Aliishimia ponticola]THH34417.1 BON domain-containing protein [Aliishimia ponticola]
MRLSTFLHVALTFVAAAIVALMAANASVGLIEDRSEIGVRQVLDDRELVWAEVSADGLQVTLTGTAPTESDRFQALAAAGSIVDAARVIDAMQVEAEAELAPPRFSIEILRNDAGISVIGLIPAAADREALTDRFERLADGTAFADFLESADYPTPDEWDESLGFALRALDKLPRAKVSVQSGRVDITAMAESEDDKAALERDLNRAAPSNLYLALNITAPRPVLTPFTLRFVRDADGIRFDACSADDEEARTRIVNAAFKAGLTGQPDCTIGMGVPTPRWSEAASLAIAAIAELEGGSVTFSDADVSLIAPEGTPQNTFDRIVGELENTLPDVFALTAVLPQPKSEQPQGPPEFTATLSPEGQVQLRGRIQDEVTRELATSYAQSLFGSAAVYTAARIDDSLPDGWSTRVLTGLEALGNLSNGAVVVTPDEVTVTGNTGEKEANARIAQLLADKLGEAQHFDISVTYQEKLDPASGIPTPEECEAEIAGIVAVSKINFEPGSANVDAAAMGTLDDIAEILKECGSIKLEIQGHTDSQGRESMNLSLSQERAQTVLDELRARRVLTSSFRAKGYGETQPVEDNGTEAGREANRRIEFRLIRPEPMTPEPQSALDSLAEQSNEDAPEEPASESEDAGDE